MNTFIGVGRIDEVYSNEKVLKLNKTVAIHCVGSKNTIYDKILEIAKNRKKQIDGYYADLQLTHNAYGFTPNLAIQTTDFSDIQNKNDNYTHFFNG